MKYAVEMGSGAMIYTPVFLKTGPGTEKVNRGDTQTARSSHKLTLFFQN
jgi:hypothetical protein